ncbi:hypothetical protein [Flavobacterium macacae]|uniref:Uncharacterized protein n=1 Tax=Flavobacterium macacae TaxID=2488993 RepID=A0A3P3WDX0_9FLAO|nr:hypothetical protein [Flavobacterium macacae]RRJ92608.1 hypothetical protein EG849_06400 [Flavobacterium macacae]
MTILEFNSNIARKNRIDKIYNYVITSLAIFGGLFFLYKFEFTEWYEIKSLAVNVAPKIMIRILYIFLITVGLYGIWRIPHLYSFSQIKCLSPIEDKLTVIEKVKIKLNFSNQKVSDNSFECKYLGLLYNPFLVRIFIDEESYLINVQQIDPTGGFIDFGNSNRVKNKITKIILKSKNPES